MENIGQDGILFHKISPITDPEEIEKGDLNFFDKRLKPE